MNRLENIQRIYFIGIGGIGMSALARYFFGRGKIVSGYDRAETFLTRQLITEGISVSYIDDVSLAPKDAGLIVYTPAIPAGHNQLRFYRENGYTVMKRSEVLGEITKDAFNICVAGTHGKTTVSTMIAHILRQTDFGCNAFLGGIAVNYNSNFWSSEQNTCVIEADEYDRSFLKLNPDIAVITAMDADHLDIYGTEEIMQDAFIEFSSKLKSGGLLLLKKGIKRSKEFSGDNILTYHISDAADVYAKNIRMTDGCYHFDVVIKNETLNDVILNMGGMHNVENAVVAIAVARQLDINAEKILQAVKDFEGVKRRFEYVVRKKQLVYIDDYAHHPEELAALIKSAVALFKGMKCTVIFQPHLYSRTRDLADEFARSLDIADEVVLLPIYPAREVPIEGVTSSMIKDRMINSSVKIADKKEVLAYFKDMITTSGLNNQVFITAGAGDIDTLVEPIRQILNASFINEC